MNYSETDNVFSDPEIALQAANGPHRVSLENWDTASILTMDGMNKVIQGQKIKLPDLKASNKFNGSIDGVWDSWDLFPDTHFIGGAVRLVCTLKSGSATDVLGDHYDLKGAKIYITVTIKTVETPSVKLVDPTADKSQPGKVHSLVLEQKAQNHIDAVTVDKIDPKKLSQPFKTLIGSWFNTNINLFNPIFHSALLNEKADKGAFQWVKPTLLSYASLTNEGGNGYFAALCKTDKKNPSWNKLANQIDSSIGDAWPNGVNSIFAISAERFVEKFLLPGAVKMFKGAIADDFDIKGDEMILTNNKMLTFKKFKLDDDTIVTPTIPKGGLTMTVVEDKLQTQFSGMSWEHPLLIGSDIFTLNFTQNVYLKLGKNKKGEPVLMTTNDYKGMKKKKEVPDIERPHISARPDRAAVNADRWIQIIAMAASVLSLGAFSAGKWIVSADEAAQTATNVADWINSADDVLDVAMDGENAVNSVSQTASDSNNLAAAAAFQSPSRAAALIKCVPYLTRFYKVSGIVAAVAGFALAVNKLAIAEDLGFDPDTIPSLNNFTENVLGAEAWPGVTGAELKHVRLAESLLLYFERTS